eukprot:6190389-Pleurochrysis_carterae.AAC.3
MHTADLVQSGLRSLTSYVPSVDAHCVLRQQRPMFKEVVALSSILCHRSSAIKISNPCVDLALLHYI